MFHVVLGLILGFGIGVVCRWFDIPSPSPLKLMGALLVLAMTLGYTLTDSFVRKEIKTGQDAISVAPLTTPSEAK